jgi:competence protein ComEC
MRTAGSTATAIAAGGLDRARRLGVELGPLRSLFTAALETEIELRRPFLWLPVAAGAGVVAFLVADHDPPVWLVVAAALGFGWAARRMRERRLVFFALCGLCAFFAGEATAAWRAGRVAAPVIGKVTIATIEGFVEQMDFRRRGARFILRVHAAEGLAPEATPFRVRLTTRRAPPFEAGTYVRLKARVLPPARASLPGGYDFARDAFFAGLGGVGSTLGKIEVAAPPNPPSLDLAARMALDRGRNALSRRIDSILGGDSGAIMVSMVTGKRDLMSEEASEIVREAGLSNMISISGQQMTLVAAICFVGLRRLLALSSTLALRYPIKKWAAFGAILLAISYDLATGSAVSTDRAMFMTLIILGAVLLDRQALSMRNLAFAALAVIVFEPEALLGASFQLSFAAVAALIAVYEARVAAIAREREELYQPILRDGRREKRLSGVDAFMRLTRNGFGALVLTTLCATAATAPFLASSFHEFSPYVLLGNPLTLAVVGLFIVPGSILGALLYPLGLDAWVWSGLGRGMDGVMAAARIAGHLPGATFYMPAFAPWAILFLTLALLSLVLWRTSVFRAIAIPFALIGLVGAMLGQPFDVAVAPTGEAVALRGPDGALTIVGSRPSLFATEQWLRADADGRPAGEVVRKAACDETGCIGKLLQNKVLALVLDPSAFVEDCLRADLVVTPLFAPSGCAASLVIDRETLRETGALTLTMGATGIVKRSARGPGEDRPWSRAPEPYWGRSAPLSEGTADRAGIVTAPGWTHAVDRADADDGTALR